MFLIRFSIKIMLSMFVGVLIAQASDGRIVEIKNVGIDRVNSMNSISKLHFVEETSRRCRDFFKCLGSQDVQSIVIPTCSSLYPKLTTYYAYLSKILNCELDKDIYRFAVQAIEKSTKISPKNWQLKKEYEQLKRMYILLHEVQVDIQNNKSCRDFFLKYVYCLTKSPDFFAIMFNASVPNQNDDVINKFALGRMIDICYEVHVRKLNLLDDQRAQEKLFEDKVAESDKDFESFKIELNRLKKCFVTTRNWIINFPKFKVSIEQDYHCFKERKLKEVESDYQAVMFLEQESATRLKEQIFTEEKNSLVSHQKLLAIQAYADSLQHHCNSLSDTSFEQKALLLKRSEPLALVYLQNQLNMLKILKHKTVRGQLQQVEQPLEELQEQQESPVHAEPDTNSLSSVQSANYIANLPTTSTVSVRRHNPYDIGFENHQRISRTSHNPYAPVLMRDLN